MRSYDSRFFAWLLTLDEEAYNPMRYVSKHELLSMGWNGFGLYGVGVIPQNNSYKIDYYIYEPGFYRVSKTHGGITGRKFFTEACSSGLPYHHMNRFRKKFDLFNERRRAAGLERYRHKILTKYYNDKNKEAVVSAKASNATRRFFSVLAMAGIASNSISQPLEKSSEYGDRQ